MVKEKSITARTKLKKSLSASSKSYLKRQARDAYVKKANVSGYRSRAAFKLKEIQDKYKILKPNHNVVDLGAAPGGWCQVAREQIGKNGKIVAIDLLYIEPIEGVNFLKADFTDDDVLVKFTAMLEGHKPDVVLSDMAPNTSGHSGTDALRSMTLAEMAADFALEHLKGDGSFLCKLFQGGGEQQFVTMLRQHFAKVQYAKPEASRKESREVFILATGFQG